MTPPRQSQGPDHRTPPPVADHHQHPFSPAAARLIAGDGPPQVIGGREVLRLLDDAGIERALLLSVAYMYGSPSRALEDELSRVRAENDWAAEQAGASTGRLVTYPSLNPLKGYAIEELQRCAADSAFGRGLKLHFGNSDVRLDEPEHLESLKGVFRAANDRGLALVLHLRASISRLRPYSATQGRIFLEELLPCAPDVPVQVAHLAGSGPGYVDPGAHEVMRVLAEAVARRDSRTENIWFDVATVVEPGITQEHADLVAGLIRQVGPQRVLYGSDAALGGNLEPREGWETFSRLPLRDDELSTIAQNLGPHFA